MILPRQNSRSVKEGGGGDGSRWIRDAGGVWLAPATGMLQWLDRTLGVNREVLALSLARLGDSIGNSILIVVIPLYVARLPSNLLHLRQALLVGILLSVYGFVNSATQPVAGLLVDRLGHRRGFIQGGLLMMAAATAVMVWAGRYLHLLGLRALQGVGFGLTLPASLSILKRSTKQETRGSAMGFFTTSRMVGFSIGPLLGGFLQTRFGFAPTFLTGAGCIALAMVCVQIWVEEPEIEPAEAEARSGGRFALFDRSLLSGELLTLAAGTFIMATTIAMMSAVEKQMNARLEQTALGFGIAFSALTVTRLLTQVPFGKLSDRIGRRPLIVGGLLLLAPSTALLGLTRTTLQLTGARLLQGVASAAIAAPGFALAADISKTGGEGRQMSILTMGFALGIAAGPLLAGLLARWWLDLPFLVGGALALLVAWATLRYVRKA